MFHTFGMLQHESLRPTSSCKDGISYPNTCHDNNVEEDATSLFSPLAPFNTMTTGAKDVSVYNHNQEDLESKEHHKIQSNLIDSGRLFDNVGKNKARVGAAMIRMTTNTESDDDDDIIKRRQEDSRSHRFEDTSGEDIGDSDAETENDDYLQNMAEKGKRILRVSKS